jgi:hypothetical protein
MGRISAPVDDKADVVMTFAAGELFRRSEDLR